MEMDITVNQNLSTIEMLTDDELREQLIESGIQAGPIVASTRKFYENKLKKILGNHTEEKEQTYEVEEDLDDTEESSEPIIKNDKNILKENPIINNSNKLYPNLPENDQISTTKENSFRLNKWSPDDMRRRPIRDFENFEYESPHLNKRFEVKPQTEETFSASRYQNYEIKTKPLSANNQGRSMVDARGRHWNKDSTREGRDSSGKKYLYYFVIAIILGGILLSLPKLVNWHDDDDNAIPIMD